MDTAKVCSKCKVEKPFTEFTRRKNVYKGVETWGYKSQCKPCHNLTTHLARKANVEKARAREAELRKQRMDSMTPEEREAHNAKCLAWANEWRKAHTDKVKEMKRKHREANKERIAAKKAADAKTEHGRALDKKRGERYRAKHPERVRELQKAQSAKRAPVAKQEARQKRVKLCNSYVAQLLQLPTAIVPPELINLERTRVLIKRMMQEKDKYRTEKKCSDCKDYKPLLAFPKFHKSKDGHGYLCLMCIRERKRKEKERQGLVYKPRLFDEFGRLKKMDPELVKAKKNARERANYLRNKQLREAT
jgi:hypothetical protein